MIVGALAAGGPVDKIVFYDFPRLSRLLLDPEERDDVLEACREADDLFVDDLGSGFVKRDGFVLGLLEEIIVDREARAYPMLATTNLAPRAFRDLFGARVYDRLRGEWGAWIHCAGPSLRRKPKMGTRA
jgi:DNA replication protein DnaC